MDRLDHAHALRAAIHALVKTGPQSTLQIIEAIQDRPETTVRKAIKRLGW